MKKSISVLALLALVSFGAFAQIGFSAGGGALFDWSFGNGYEVTAKSGSEEFKSSTHYSNLGIGGFAFFNATYAELQVSFAYGIVKDKSEMKMFGLDNVNTAMDITTLNLGVTLLGKYPIDLGGFTISPLLGASYVFVLSAKYKDENGNMEHLKKDATHEMGQFGVLAGVGFDYDLNTNLYLTAQALFHLRFSNKFVNDSMKADQERAKASGGTDEKGSTALGLGPRVTLGVGYRF